MAAMTMDREPDMARFIDTYKFDQEMANRREKFGGGTSLPLHSDGYEDKQRALREERHHDWMVQQEKNLDHPYTIIKHPNMAPVSYGPQNAADYDEEINKMTDRYNTGYDEQKQLEEEKFSSRHRAPPRPVQPMGPQIDYNQAGELAKAEEKRAYQDYMKAKEERYWQMRGRPVTPPGGLNIGNYDRQLKETAAAKKKEYKEMLDQQQKEHMYLRAKQEPGVPVIDRNAPYLASKPPPGPVYNRPPPRDEAFKTNTYSRQPPPAPEQALNGPSGFSNDGLRPAENRANGYYDRPPQSSGRPRSRPSLESDKKNAQPTNMESGMQISPRRMKNTLYQDSEEVSVKRLEASKERQKDYNEYLKLKNEERRRHDEEKYQNVSKPAEVVKNQYYSSDDYEKFQKEIQRKQSEEYREFLAKKAGETRNRDWNVKENGVLELHGDDAVQSKQRELRAERQKEYNNYISQRKRELRNPYDNYVYPMVAVAEKPIVAHMGFDVEQRQRYLREERKREYEQYKAQVAPYDQKVKHPDRRHDFVDTASGPYGGLFHGLGEHGNRSEMLNKERQREYNEQYAGKDKISGRPNWARETLPNNVDRGRSPMKVQPPVDQYQQMLDEKRREEMSRRRYDDPEYQGRLADSREREAGQRYAGY